MGLQQIHHIKKYHRNWKKLRMLWKLLELHSLEQHLYLIYLIKNRMTSQWPMVISGKAEENGERLL
jgi:hypothetical protein